MERAGHELKQLTSHRRSDSCLTVCVTSDFQCSSNCLLKSEHTSCWARRHIRRPSCSCWCVGFFFSFCFVLFLVSVFSYAAMKLYGFSSRRCKHDTQSLWIKAHSSWCTIRLGLLKNKSSESWEVCFYNGSAFIWQQQNFFFALLHLKAFLFSPPTSVTSAVQNIRNQKIDLYPQKITCQC